MSQGFRQGTKGAGFLTVPYLGPQQGRLEAGELESSEGSFIHMWPLHVT